MINEFKFSNSNTQMLQFLLVPAAFNSFSKADKSAQTHLDNMGLVFDA